MAGLFRPAFEKTRDALVVTSTDGTVLDWNPQAARMLGRAKEEAIGKRFAAVCGGGRILNRMLSAARNEGYCRNEICFQRQGNDEVIGQISVFPIKGRQKQFLWVICDVTGPRRTEQALQEANSRFEAFAKHSPAALWFGAADGKRLIFVSSAVQRITGLRPVDLLEYPQWSALIHPGDRVRFRNDVATYFQGKPVRHKYRITRPDGGLRWIQSDGFPIQDAKGEICLIGGFLQDITDQQEAEERLRLALDEKEALLKEIHHRVKNNLQIISSLLRLQASTADPKSAALLRDSRNRIETIALIHEHIYRNNKILSVKFPGYVKRLIANLISLSNTSPGAIRIKVDIDRFVFPPQIAVLCGLILNELVYNSLRHAFPHGRKGEIDIRVKSTARESVILVVSDNGIGVPAGFDIQGATTLGLKLVRQLARQLKGKVTVSNRRGMTVRIEFPAAQTA